jgi:hypothetical protein
MNRTSYSTPLVVWSELLLILWGMFTRFSWFANKRGISRQYEDAKLSSLNLTLEIELSCKQSRSSTMYNRSMFKVVPDTRSTDPVVIVKYIWQAHPSNAHFGFFSRREYQLHRPLQILSLRVLRMSRLQYLIGGCACPIIYADGVAAEVMRICEFSPQRGYLNIINFESTSCANHQSHHCVCLRELTVFSYHNHSVPSPGRAWGHVMLNCCSRSLLERYLQERKSGHILEEKVLDINRRPKYPIHQWFRFDTKIMSRRSYTRHKPIIHQNNVAERSDEKTAWSRSSAGVGVGVAFSGRAKDYECDSREYKFGKLVENSKYSL